MGEHKETENKRNGIILKIIRVECKLIFNFQSHLLEISTQGSPHSQTILIRAIHASRHIP